MVCREGRRPGIAASIGRVSEQASVANVLSDVSGGGLPYWERRGRVWVQERGATTDEGAGDALEPERSGGPASVVRSLEKCGSEGFLCLHCSPNGSLKTHHNQESHPSKSQRKTCRIRSFKTMLLVIALPIVA
jgi:hypothetical protein